MFWCGDYFFQQQKTLHTVSVQIQKDAHDIIIIANSVFWLLMTGSYLVPRHLQPSLLGKSVGIRTILYQEAPQRNEYMYFEKLTFQSFEQPIFSYRCLSGSLLYPVPTLYDICWLSILCLLNFLPVLLLFIRPLGLSLPVYFLVIPTK